MQSAYEQLPIYKSALDLTAYLEKTVVHFNHHFKYGLGGDLRNESRKIMVAIAKANVLADRRERLEEVRERLLELKILVHIAREVKAFNSLKSVEFSIKSIVDVSKQCE